MWLADLVNKIKQSKFINWSFCDNKWIWFHIFAGSLLFNILIVCNVIWWLAGIIIVIIAIIWEFIEFYVESNGKWENVIKTYGSVEKWVYDTLGDVLGVVIIILISLIGILL